MKTVVISVMPLDQSREQVRRLLASGGGDPVSRINFVSWDLFHKVLAPNRMQIVQAMAGAGSLSIREIARRVGRDFKGVHTDIVSLIANGVVEKSADGKVLFPYDDIHVESHIPAIGLSSAA